MAVAIREVETAIVERLTPILAPMNILVHPFPENPNEFGLPIRQGEVFVGFKSESLTRPQMAITTSPITQERTLEFELVLRLRDLRSNKGTYEAIDAIRTALVGFRPGDSRFPLYQIAARFLDLKDAIWVYVLTFGLSSPVQFPVHPR